MSKYEIGRVEWERAAARMKKNDDKCYTGNDAICPPCAQKAGLLPRDGCFGHWVGKCSVCGVETTCCARRDYKEGKL
jgi:hypothetical protein